jgi:hypothetical protein
MIKKLIPVLFILGLCGLLCAQAADWKWGVQAGGSGADEGGAITRDRYGNVYVAGAFENSVSFGGTVLNSMGSSDFFLAKMDPSGNWLWAISAGGDSLDCASEVEVDTAGNIYISGWFGGTATFGAYSLTAQGYSDTFAAKLDSSGNWLWVRQIVSSYAVYGFLHLDLQGNVWLTGVYSGATLFGAALLHSSVYDIFVCKLDNAGNWLWVTRIHGPSLDLYTGAVVGADGNAYLCGNYTNSLNFGSVQLQAQANQQSFVAMIDPDGNCQWAMNFNSASYQYCSSIALDNSGGVMVSGELHNSCIFGNTTLTSYGTDDIFIARLSTQGEWMYAVQVGTASQEYPYSMCSAQDGTYICGLFSSDLSFGDHNITYVPSNSFFIAKLSNTGVWLWAKAWSGTGYLQISAMVGDNVGNAILTGGFYGTQTLGTINLNCEMPGNIFVAKIGSLSLPEIAVSGRIVGNASPQTGISGVGITLSGVADYAATTAADGGFSFAGVLSHEVYALNCSIQGFDPLSAVVEANSTNISLGDLIINETCYAPAGIQAAVEGINASISWTAPRDLTGYQLWRLNAGCEADTSSWIPLTPSPITHYTYLDTGWDLLPYGTYCWAVKAVYYGGRYSPPVFSNSILNYAHQGTVEGIVTGSQGEPVSSVSVRCGSLFTQSGIDGSFSLLVSEGTHQLHISHPCYAAETVEVQVVTAQATIADMQMNPSDLLLSEDFEIYPEFSLSCPPWVVQDVDQETNQMLPGYSYPNGDITSSFLIFAPEATIPPLTTIEAHSGSQFAASLAGQMLGNNDWLISPVIRGGGTLSFWARSFSSTNSLEMFRVGVSTGGTETADFAFISGNQVVLAPVQWTEFTYSLANWHDQDIRIGFNCVSYLKRMFCLDDIAVSGSDAVSDPGAAPVISAFSAAPNPFTKSARISFNLDKQTHCSAGIYNLRGQMVKLLVDEKLASGVNYLVWDGKDNNGHDIAPGVYLCRLSCGEVFQNLKLIRLK